MYIKITNIRLFEQEKKVIGKILNVSLNLVLVKNEKIQHYL